jgi:hypothetical protein
MVNESDNFYPGLDRVGKCVFTLKMGVVPAAEF